MDRVNASQQSLWSGIILAGGAGARFGGPKAAARWHDGSRLVDRAASLLQAAGARSVIAVLPPGIVAPPAVTAVVNPTPTSEQIRSLRLGLMQLANQPVLGVLVWPVDHPFVRAETLNAIVEAGLESKAPIVLPVCPEGRGHPVWFNRDCWRELMTVPDGGARAVVHQYGARVLELVVDDTGIRRNVTFAHDLIDSID